MQLNLQTIQNSKESASYGFTYGTVSGYTGLYPLNRGVQSSYGYAKITFDVPKTGNVVVSYYQGSEKSYDYGQLSNIDSSLSLSSSADSSVAFNGYGFDGTGSYTYSNVSKGTHFITVKYRKDGSVDTSPDMFIITGITVPDAPREYTISVQISDGSYTGENKIFEGDSKTITLIANQNYKLPETISVNNASYTYDIDSGEVVLSNPNDNVEIVATCEIASLITKFDLSSLDLSEGVYTIKVRAKANNWIDSDDSNQVEYNFYYVDYDDEIFNRPIYDPNGYTVSFTDDRSNEYGNINSEASIILYFIDGSQKEIHLYYDLSQLYYEHVESIQLAAQSPSKYLYYYMGDTEYVLYNIGSGQPSEIVKLSANAVITYEMFGQNCVLADTQVLMADRTYKAIGDIKVGDMILSYDWDTMSLIENPVIYASGEDTENVWTTIRYFVWTFDDGTILKTAFTHRFYNVDKGVFIYLEKFDVGDRVLKLDGTTPRFVSKTTIREKCTFARITGKYGTNYFANNCLTGNSECPKITIDKFI